MMATMEYYCITCRAPYEFENDGRCPRCGDLGGGYVQEEEVLPPGQRPEWVFSSWQWRQGIAGIVLRAMHMPIHNKRWTARAREILSALEEYAESRKISTKDKDWKKKAIALLSGDMFSLVLPMLPRITFAGWDVDQASLEQWARELRRLMNREATEELIGTSPEQDIPTTPQVTKAEAVILLALEIEFARRSGRLDEDDDRAIKAYQAAADEQREAAQALGWTETQFRQRLHRIREKLA
jgi:hypothetical protein